MPAIPWTMAASSPPGSGLLSIIVRRSKFRKAPLTQVEVSSLSGPVWSVNPFRNTFSRFSCSRQLTNASLSWGDARSGLSITVINWSAPPASSMQTCSSLESWDIAGSAVGAGMTVGAGGSVGRAVVAVGGTSVGILVAAGISVGSGVSTGAVVANWIGAALGVWATGAGVGVCDWPEQAMRVARAVSKVK